MSDAENVFVGCFVSESNVDFSKVEASNSMLSKGEIFRQYVWGERGVANILKSLKQTDYGEDLRTILFKFYVNPIPYEVTHIKKIEGFRATEKSIALGIIVNDENFFELKELERLKFLKDSILERVLKMEELVKKRKLKFDFQKFSSDTLRIMNSL